MSTAAAPAGPLLSQSSSLDNYPFTAMNILRCVEYININLIEF
jgi:hypothetical protein